MSLVEPGPNEVANGTATVGGNISSSTLSIITLLSNSSIPDNLTLPSTKMVDNTTDAANLTAVSGSIHLSTAIPVVNSIIDLGAGNKSTEVLGGESAKEDDTAESHIYSPVAKDEFNQERDAEETVPSDSTEPERK